MKQITGSQAVMESLLLEKVDVIFGYPGGAIMPIYNALHDYTDKIRHILVRHEQGAAHAAEGYARITGKPGVCFATSGPGSTNLVTGIADAKMDSVPLVCITGQVSAEFLGTDAFQEAPITAITKPITKWNYQVTDATQIPEAIAKAFYIAKTGRPGPVLVDITKNAQFALFDYQYKKVEYLEEFASDQKIDEEKIREAAQILQSAQKPYILIGHGVHIAKAYKDVLEVAEKLNAPVAATLHGLSGFPSKHALFMGMLGMHGNYGPNVLTNEADVILALGMRFDDRVTGNLARYAKQAKIIHIDIDPKELSRKVKTYVPIAGDLKNMLQALLPHLTQSSHSEWLSKFGEYHAKELEKVIVPATSPNEGPITMAEVVHLVSEKTRGKAILVADVGQHQMVTARYAQFTETNSFITSGGLGTMGFALPAAIGASVAASERQVIAFIGDGGFQMTIQELATIAQEKLPVKIIVFNNSYLGMVRQWQEMFFEKRYSFVHLDNPNFVAIAEGFGVKAQKVVERESLHEALDVLVAADGPQLLEVVVKTEDNVFPMIPTGASVDEVRLE